MSRLYDALCQAGLERTLDQDLPVVPASASELSQADMEKVEVSPDLSSPSTSSIASLNGLQWDLVNTFTPVTVPSTRLVALRDESDIGAEKFRLLRIRLQHLKTQSQIKTVVITSALAEEGKSLVALNLGMSLAKHTEQRVLMIEGDLHKPVFAARTGTPGSRGLSDWIRKGGRIEDYLYRIKDSMLWMLPAGAPDQQSLSTLQSSSFADVMDVFRKSFDWILVDTPPLVPFADVSFWSHQSDGILLVVREGMTSAKMLKKGLETLDSARILGIVFNDTRGSDHNYYYRYKTNGHTIPSNGKPHIDE